MGGIGRAYKRVKEGKILAKVLELENEEDYIWMKIQWEKDGNEEEFEDYGSDVRIEESVEIGDTVMLSIVGDYDALFRSV